MGADKNIAQSPLTLLQENELRQLGIDALGAVPWGTHVCHFYHTKQDLIDVLVPYFQAGLENNESCLWITSNTLSVKEAEAAMEQAVPEFPRYLASRQMAIIPHTEWYLKDGPFNGKRMLIAWINKIWQALDSGYDGVRVTCDTAWIERGDWHKFINYEEEVNNTIGKYRVLAMCTYPLHKYGASQVIDVMNNHQFNLIKHKGRLVLIGSSEYQRLQETLQESEEFSSSLLHYSPNPILIVNPDTSLCYVNPALERLTGFSSDELIGTKAPYPWWTPETLQSTRRDLAKAMREGAVGLEELFQKKNGERFWVEITSMPVKHEGELKYYRSSWIDITERKRAEEELVESEEKYRAILERSSDSIVLMDEEDIVLVDFNEKAYQNLGYRREEFAKLKMADIDVIESDDEIREHLRKLKREGRDVFETKHRTKDGKIRDVLVSIRHLHTSDKSYVLAVWHYLAEHPVDEALQISEPHYRELFQSINEGVLVVGEGKKYLDCNEAVLKMLGYSREEFLSLTLDDVVHPDFRLLQKDEPSLIWTGETVRLESAYCAKDGRVIPVEVVACRIDYRGKPAILITVRDITGRKQAEEEQQAIVKTSLDGYWVNDLEGRFLEVNDAYCKMTGYTREELLKMSIQDIEAVESPEEVMEHIEKGVKQRSAHFESRHKCKDGRIIDVEVNTNYLDVGEMRAFSFCRDITEREQAEETLRESEEKYRMLVEDAVIGVVNVDINGKITYVNKTILEATGYSWEELVDKNGFRLGLVPSETLKVLRKRMKEKLMGQPPGLLEMPFKCKDGEWIWLQIRGRVLRKHGMPVGIQIIGYDITARKQAEEALLESEEKYRAVFEKSSDSIVLMDAQNQVIVDFNERAYRNLGYSREEFARLKLGDIEALESDAETREHLEKIYKKGKDIFETRHRTKDGDVRDVVVSVRPLHTGDKNFVLNIWRYITEREQMDEVLLASERRYRELFQGIGEGVLVLDEGRRYLDCNEAVLKMLGYSREELLSLTLDDIVHPDYQRIVKDKPARVWVGETMRLETAYCAKDGRVIPVEVVVSKIDYQGKPAVLSTVRDITGRQRAEEAQGILRSASTRPLTQLQERFIRSGFRELEDQEVIELLLSLVLPARRSRQLAKACLERFQNLRGFLAASSEELEQAGITVPCMLCIRLLHELPIKVLQQRLTERSIFKSSREVFDYLYYSMRDLREEVFKVIYLNSRSQVIDTDDLFEGTADYIHIRPREVVESAIVHNASGLVFVHNHPTGDPTPSKTDKQLTRDLVFVGQILQIKILDHIIIGDNSYFSFADDGLIQKYEDNFLNLKIKGVLASIPLYQHHGHSIGGFYHSTLSHIGTYLMRRKKTLHRPSRAKADGRTVTA